MEKSLVAWCEESLVDNKERILISGSSGFIGSNLKKHLTALGYAVSSLVRRKPINDSEIFWSPENQTLDKASLENFSAFINLSGESIFGRWSTSKKEKIFSSRIDSSKLLVRTVLEMKSPPKSLITASAIGFYGDTGASFADENFKKGVGFLADVVDHWESTFAPVESLGVRVVKIRLGIVLSPHGGALKEMLLPFRLGLGGPLGDGKATMSWIALDDVLEGIFHCLRGSVAGPVNFTSPQPETNENFSKTLAAILGRPCIFRVPEFALKLLFGEFASEGLLKNIAARPQKLLMSGYDFKHVKLEEYLRLVLTSQPLRPSC